MDSDTIRNSLCNASSVLTIFFVAEVIMKMIAFTPYGYWQSRRNRADLVVTILGVGWIVVDYIFNNHYTLSFGTFYNTVQSYFHLSNKRGVFRLFFFLQILPPGMLKFHPPRLLISCKNSSSSWILFTNLILELMHLVHVY